MTPAQAMLLFEAHRVRAFAIGLVGVATLGAIVVWRLGGAPLGQLVHGLALATTAHAQPGNTPPGWQISTRRKPRRMQQNFES